MFADFSTDSDWSGHSHRRWTTLISFALQALAVGCLLLLPLLYSEGLPKLVLVAPFLLPAIGLSDHSTVRLFLLLVVAGDERQTQSINRTEAIHCPSPESGLAALQWAIGMLTARQISSPPTTRPTSFSDWVT
jgi:hypothetical protein